MGITPSLKLMILHLLLLPIESYESSLPAEYLTEEEEPTLNGTAFLSSGVQICVT